MGRMTEEELQIVRDEIHETKYLFPTAQTVNAFTALNLTNEIKASWQEIKELQAENEMIRSVAKEFIRGLGSAQGVKDAELKLLRQEAGLEEGL